MAEADDSVGTGATRLDFFYRSVAEHIEREQTLINRRISWLLTFEGFLFAGLALVADAKSSADVRSAMKNIIPILGGVAAVLTCLGVVAAYMSIDTAKNFWKEKQLAGSSAYPPAFGSARASVLGRITSLSVPLVIAGAWIYVSQSIR